MYFILTLFFPRKWLFSQLLFNWENEFDSMLRYFGPSYTAWCSKYFFNSTNGFFSNTIMFTVLFCILKVFIDWPMLFAVRMHVLFAIGYTSKYDTNFWIFISFHLDISSITIAMVLLGDIENSFLQISLIAFVSIIVKSFVESIILEHNFQTP